MRMRWKMDIERSAGLVVEIKKPSEQKLEGLKFETVPGARGVFRLSNLAPARYGVKPLTANFYAQDREDFRKRDYE